MNSFEGRAVLTVRLTRQFYLRMWVAKMLLRLAARVAGAGIQFEETEE